jgi:hypothetical protein
MARLKLVTGHEAGLSGDDQIRIVLHEIVCRGGSARTGDFYEALEKVLGPRGMALSEQGKSSLRFFINKVAVQAGYVRAHDPNSPGWRITAEGRAFAEVEAQEETAVDVDTGVEERVLSGSARGDAFERYTVTLLRAIYPHYAWYHQGRDKGRERGIDFVGNRLGDARGEHGSIGVQVKFHAPSNAPTEKEWLKFLAGCFARRLEAAVFITTGRLTGEQRREAQEARVVVIEGRDEILRLASIHGLERFELFEDSPSTRGGPAVSPSDVPTGSAGSAQPPQKIVR